MRKFKESPVLFDEENHEYELDGRRLLGITGLIHSVLGLGVYPDTAPYTSDYVIPRAGSRGTAVHHAIELYDTLHVRQPIQKVLTRFGCVERDNIREEELEWDVSFELEAYIRHLDMYGLKPLANELTVSDNKRWASKIDNVYLMEKTGGIWLGDTKTNNVALYPRCGYFIPDYFGCGEEALKEYLSWQLSVYAELFEAENPEYKVEGLLCNWLGKEADELWEIVRKPSELVWELLSSEYMFTDNGEIYYHHDPSVFGVGSRSVAPAESKLPILTPEVVEYFNRTLREFKEVETRLGEAKEGLRAAMIKHEVKNCDFGGFSATIAADSETVSFDVKSFRKDHPELYEKYVIRKPKKGSFTVKLKEI